MGLRKPVFCPKCGSLMKAEKLPSGELLFVCPKCGAVLGETESVGGRVVDRTFLMLLQVLKKEKQKAMKEVRRSAVLCEVVDNQEGIITLMMEGNGSLPKLRVGDFVGMLTGEGVKRLGTVIDVYGNEITVLGCSVLDIDDERLRSGSRIILVCLEPLIAYDLQMGVILDAFSEEGAVKLEIPVLVQNDEAFDLFRENGNGRVKEANSKPLERRVAVEGENLDESQKRAVEAALSLGDGELLVIVGPPGTGKTRVIACIARKLAERGERVLIASHTNRAVDNAVMLLPVEYTLRVGAPEKVLDKVKPYLLCSYSRGEYGRALMELDSKLHKQLELHRSLYRDLVKALGRNEEEAKRIMKAINDLKKEIRELVRLRRELIKSIIEKELARARIIGATLVKTQLPPLVNTPIMFDTVIIDEASQASITLALLAMVRGRKWIIVGDHKQLLPIFKSLPDTPELLEELSAFTSLKKRFKNRVLWLETHYRSNAEIIGFSAKYVYEGRIKPHESCYAKKLVLKKQPELPPLNPDKPVVFVHVLQNPAKMRRENGSIANLEEAETVARMIRELVSLGVEPGSIGVITPYKLQRSTLASMLENLVKKGLEIDTVDSFQGREKDVIILSLTCTSAPSFDFVSNPHRLNVAVTRAVKKLIVVGDAENISMMSKHKLLYKLLEYCLEKNSVYDWQRKRWLQSISNFHNRFPIQHV